MRLDELFARSSIEVLGGRLWQPHEEAPAAPVAPLPSAAADEESPVRRKAAPAVITKDLSCASVLSSSSVSTEALRSPTASVSPADPQKQERLTNGRRLYAAVRREHEPAVCTLLASPRIDVNCRDRERNTALHWAVSNKSPSILRALLQHPDLDVDRGNHEGCTALHLAAAGGHDAAVGLLLESGRTSLSLIHI